MKSDMGKNPLSENALDLQRYTIIILIQNTNWKA